MAVKQLSQGTGGRGPLPAASGTSFGDHSFRCGARLGRRPCPFAIAIGVALAMSLPHAPAQAALGDLVGGVGDIISGALAIPVETLAGTVQGPFILGTVGGILRGALRTVGYATRGALRVVGAAIPLAAKAAPLIPLFL